MNETTVEILKALGYPLSSVVALVVLAYLSRQFFQKLLETVVARDLEDVKRQNAERLEATKKEYSLLLEERKGELGRETERLRASLSVEVETYRLAAAKRFKCLMALWESSESLFRETDFSDRDSVKAALTRVNTSVGDLNKYSVLFSHPLTKCLNDYLNTIATVLTNKESDFVQGKAKPKDVAKLIGLAANVLGAAAPEVASTLSITSAIVPEIVLSVSSRLEEQRQTAAEAAREELAAALRVEFGVVFSEKKSLVASITNAQNKA